MKKFFLYFPLVVFFVMLLLNCAQRKMRAPAVTEKKIVVPGLIPKPLEIKVLPGMFRLGPNTRILVQSDKPEAQKAARFLADRISKPTGFHWEISNKAEAEDFPGGILLTSAGAGKELGAEGYRLSVDRKGVVVRGQPAGLFYGVQTLLQLLPPQIFRSGPVREKIDWVIPSVQITDKPRFSWRGMHLDVGRHLFPVEFIKKYIDELAMNKMNRFHWHLTEDQGWRIEIKKYPRLTEIGAYRNGTVIGKMNMPYRTDSIRYGGFYTQEQIREVVKYAADRFITVVPEIEMPGHSVAALTAYPHLSCTGGPFEVRQIWGISDDIYCAGNDSVFTFLQDVLTEVMALFPSKYIHIGGDEAPKVRWEQCPKCQRRIKEEGLKDEHELQSYFIQRIEKFLNSKGRRIIGWDEILEGGLAPNAAVMSWRGTKGGIEAARQNHDVVMTPTDYCYFDYYQGDPATEPLAIGGFLPLEKVYSYEPLPEELTPEQSHHILGAQGNVWTEYMKTPEMVEYMALPRMCALAEVDWSVREQRDEKDFLHRMEDHYARMDEMGIHYRQPPLTGFSARNVFVDAATVEIKRSRPDSRVRFTLDGSDPTENSPLYTGPFPVRKSLLLKAREFFPNGHVSRIYQGRFIRQKPLPAAAPDKTKGGLSFQYFEFEKPVYTTADLEKLHPKTSGNTSEITFPAQDLPEQFGLIFNGFIQIPAEGIYTFTIYSNDGSRLLIDGLEVVENDGWHGAQAKSGQIALQAGLHTLRLSYFQAGGGKALKAFIEGPGMEKHRIAAAELFQ